MKLHKFTVALIVGLAFGAANAHAAKNPRLETEVYVFRNRDFQSVEIPGATAAGTARIELLRSPAAIRFDAESLSLDRSGLSWSGGRPPGRLTAIATPDVALVAGKPVSFLSAVPAQYVERTDDGVLRLREISADSPDAPHWRLTFTLDRGVQKKDDANLTCSVEIAMVSARESLPGVRLDVGKPILARFSEKLELATRPDEWLGLLVEPGAGADYSVLALLKITEGKDHDGSSVAGERPMNAEEFAQFVTYYYREPRPDRIAQAMEAVGKNELLDTGDRFSYGYRQRAGICVGFFAEVFAANPAYLPEWRKVIDRRVDGGMTRYWLREAVEVAESRTAAGSEPVAPDSVNATDFYWGAFLASGEPDYLRKLVDRLKLLDDPESLEFEGGAKAMRLLAYHAPHHPRIREALVAARPLADPRSRSHIDDLLAKDLTAVHRKIRENEPRDLHRVGTDYLTVNSAGIPLPPPHPPVPSSSSSVTK